jgi:hypothetical protein
MLDTTPLDKGPDTPRDAADHNTVNSEFAELVYADPAWLDAEFDAIMTANFGARIPPSGPPPTSPRSWPGATGPRRGHHTSRSDRSGARCPNAVRSGRSGGRRGRSPPLPDGQ